MARYVLEFRLRGLVPRPAPDLDGGGALRGREWEACERAVDYDEVGDVLVEVDNRFSRSFREMGSRRQRTGQDALLE